jgi:hypothetical protein
VVRFKGWDRVQIADDSGVTRDAIVPVIISASRSTDIPAFYGEWFMNRLFRGYAVWVNPWNGKRIYVSFARTRVIAFWSKNPRPFLEYLPRIEESGIACYFLYTLNDYQEEGLEPRLPGMGERERTFLELSDQVGKERVVWRFDPLLLSDSLGVDDLLSRVERIGSRLHRSTRRLVISFVDIAKYPRVRQTLDREGFPGVREFSTDEMAQFCGGLQEINTDWGLLISACGEERDLSQYGIGRGQCINGDLMREAFSADQELMRFLGPAGGSREAGQNDMPFRHLKDPGQRGACGCIASKDIGQYSTCMHLCRYCYANASTRRVEQNYRNYLASVEGGVFPESITGDREGI